MSTQTQIKEALEGAKAYLTEHPDEASYRDGAVTATLVEGLRCEVTDGDGNTATTDMPTSVGGDNSAGSAGWLLRGALASCNATLIAMHAALAGVELETLRVTVDSASNDLGILGLDPEVPPGPLSVRIAVEIASPDADEDQLRALVNDAVAHCPVTDAVQRAVTLETDVDVTGDAA